MLKQQINDDLKTAMLSGDKPLASVLRDLKSAILLREVAENKRDEGLDDATIIAVLKKEKKSRKESIEVYEKAGADERKDIEQYQLGIIEQYLPDELSEEDTEKLVQGAIEGMSEVSMKDMGKIIATVKQESSDVDGATLAKIVKKKLGA